MWNTKSLRNVRKYHFFQRKFKMIFFQLKVTINHNFNMWLSKGKKNQIAIVSQQTSNWTKIKFSTRITAVQE